MKRIAIVLINYFKEEELVSFVRNQLLTQLEVDLYILVVDNGSKNSALLKELTCNQVEVIDPQKNLGYFGAASLAFDRYQSANGIPDYFVVSNFDLSFDPKHFFEKFLTLDEQHHTMVSGPSITSGINGSLLNPMYRNRLSKSRINRLRLVTSFYPFFFVYQLLHYLKRAVVSTSPLNTSGVEEVYAVHGSMMFFSKNFFTSGGNLRFGSFLYGEELFIAEQVFRMNRKAVVYDDLIVEHEEHSTTGRIKGARHMRYLNQSMNYIMREFYS